LIYAKVSVSTGSLKAKTKTVSTVYVQNTNASQINLGVSDVISINSIVALDITDELPQEDATGKYQLDNGQRDHAYEHASLILTKGATPISPISHTILKVEIQHFTSSQLSGYFSVNSYEEYENIPAYKTQSGSYVSLRDTIDFRPVRYSIGLSSTMMAPITA
jgi:hypothetical protein